MPAPAYGSLPFKEQIAFFRQKVNLPTERWDDLVGAAHDRAFVVAGAQKADLLADLRAAVTKAIEQGTTLATFRQDFDALVARHGWTGWTGESTAAGRAWRTRVIYETNLRASYAAGRWAQIQQVKAVRPYLLYRHNDNVLRPRLEHLAWDGKVIPTDDPWWQTHFPPNGWGCQCRVHAVDEDYLRQRGKGGPDPAPTGPDDMTGIDRGWDYAPGASLDLREFIDGKAASLPGPIAQQFANAVTSGVQNKPAPWPMLKGSAATLDEIKRLGGERLQELLDLLTPDDRQMFPAMTDRNIRVEEMISQGGLSHASVTWLRAELLRRLKDARAIGGMTFNLSNKSGKGVELSKRVASKLPDSWVEKVNASGGPYKVKVVENSRGWHSAWQRTIQTNSGSTSEHEWAHAVQSADPALDSLFQEEHRLRTANEPLEWLGPPYKKEEKARKDGYISAYQGKEYGSRGALEVITMAMQAVLGEDYQANSFLAGMLLRDREMLRLAFGVLFHYQP